MTQVKQAILHAEFLPLELQDGITFGEQGHYLHLDRCLVECAYLRGRVGELSLQFSHLGSLQPDIRIPESRDLVAKAHIVGSMLTNWAENLPSDWTFSKRTQATLQDNMKKECTSKDIEDCYNGMIAVYPSLAQAIAWNLYRTCRIITNSITSRSLMNADPSDRIALQQKEVIQSNTQTLVDDICASVPFHIDSRKCENEQINTTNETGRETARKPSVNCSDVVARRAHLLTLPLMLAQVAHGIQDHQREWIESKLLLLSRITGNGTIDVTVEVRFLPPNQNFLSQSDLVKTCYNF